MSDRQANLRSKLIDLLGNAAEPDRRITSKELVDAGVPKRYAAAISRESLRILDADAAVDQADSWATYIAQEMEAEEKLTAKQIADRVEMF